MKGWSVILLAFGAVLASCSGGKEDSSQPDPAPSEITLSVPSISVSADGDSYSLTVTSPSRPKISGLPDWVRLTDGTYDKYKITIGLTVSSNETYDAREAELVISASNVSSVLCKISQSGKAKPFLPQPGVDEYGWENAASASINMGTGWNLGNTLDSNSGDANHMWIEAYSKRTTEDYETAWGQAVTTRELIHMFKEAGFSSIRVPVTWYPHIGTITLDNTDHWDMSTWTGYDVDPVWMARVKEVVDYVIDEGMYCILNVHHDTGDASTAWLRADTQVYAAVKDRFCALWKQIAEEFKSYGQKLLFESFNEMLDAKGTWNYSTSEAHGVINLYNADFVRTVRATGGNNAHRNLVLNVYCASSSMDAIKDFVLPEDSAKNHLLAEVHSYAPYQFAFDVESGARTEFDDYCASEIKRQIDSFYEGLVSKGIPTVIGEYGCTSKRADAEIAKQLACYVSAAARYNIPCFCWMLLSDGQDRSVPKWTKPALKDAIIKAYNESKQD